MAKLTVFYNGACPVCRGEMKRYRAEAIRDDRVDLNWTNIAAPSQHDALIHRGVTQDMAYRRLYAVDAQGRLLEGVEAFTAL